MRVIAESTDYICAERLTPNLVWLAKHLAAHGELTLSPQLLDQLGRISVSTVERILTRIRQDEPRLPRRGPKQRNRLLRDVPMKRIPWQEQEPGHFEVDLVHHCGPSASGEYVHTIQMIDVATAWSERVAVLGRSYLVIEDGFNRILARLPFPVQEVHPDNGSEFFNNHMLRFWHGLKPKPQLSRSRPYHKNDNRFVEAIVNPGTQSPTLKVDRVQRRIMNLDEFQIVFYHLWHHEGRRARQGAMMGAPDWAHWHGFFELQQDLYDLEATNPCGEQPLPPYGSCLLGSVNLTKFVVDPFTDTTRFDWDEFRKVVSVFTRSVTGAGSLERSGQLSRVVDRLTSCGLVVNRYTVNGEPSPDVVDTAVNEFSKNMPDVVAAIGIANHVRSAFGRSSRNRRSPPSPSSRDGSSRR